MLRLPAAYPAACARYCGVLRLVSYPRLRLAPEYGGCCGLPRQLQRPHLRHRVCGGVAVGRGGSSGRTLAAEYWGALLFAAAPPAAAPSAPEYWGALLFAAALRRPHPRRRRPRSRPPATSGVLALHAARPSADTAPRGPPTAGSAPRCPPPADTAPRCPPRDSPDGSPPRDSPPEKPPRDSPPRDSPPDKPPRETPPIEAPPPPPRAPPKPRAWTRASRAASGTLRPPDSLLSCS